MSENLGSGLPRWGPSHAAADLVDRRLDLVAADWQASCLGIHDDARGMLRVLVGALHDCGGNTRAGHHHPSAAERFEASREHFAQLDASAITCLREVLRRQVLLDLAPQEALAALHCVSATLDELHGLVAAWTGERLQHLAYVDELTGLGNRRAALESAQSFVATAVRHDRPLTVVVADVDGLKRVNDGQGHDAGDDLLRRLADAFRSGLREGDSAFRTGGDEFLVLLPETTLEDAEVVLARVRAAGAPTFSYGAAEAPDEAMTVDEVVRVADQRLLEGRRVTRSRPPAPEPAPAPTRNRPAFRTAGAGVLAVALAAVLGTRTAVSGFDLADAASVTGVGILVALLAAAAQSGRRSPAAVTILAPLLGVAAASAAAPMFDAETRPSERIEHVAQPTTVSSAASNGRAAIVEVPTGTVPAFPSWLGTTTTTVDFPTVPLPAQATALVPPATTTTAAPTTTTSSTAPSTTTTSTTAPSTTTSTTAPTPSSTVVASSATSSSTTTTTTPPARVVAVDDDVVSDRRNVVIDVLANDHGRGTTIDRSTVAIVRRPGSGTVTVLEDGRIQYRGGEEPDDSFQYQVCATNRTCSRAWVRIERAERYDRGRDRD